MKRWIVLTILPLLLRYQAWRQMQGVAPKQMLVPQWVWVCGVVGLGVVALWPPIPRQVISPPATLQASVPEKTWSTSNAPFVLSVPIQSGSFSAGHCVQFDGYGNIVDSGGGCINSSTSNGLAYYSSSGTTITTLSVSGLPMNASR